MSQKLTPILIVISIISAFFAGTLWQKVRNLEKGKTTGTVTATPQAVQPLSLENLKKYAKELKLNTKDFNNCLDKAKYEQKVKDELKEGENLGVTGTPAFFINGLLLGGAYPYEAFRAVIDFELKGGDWKKPDVTVKYLVDKNYDNGEIEIARKTVNLGDSPQKGEAEAPVKIIEYSDFQCPFCARHFTQTAKQIEDNYIKNGKVLLAFKQYPLNFHPFAQKAAEASLCANDQGKFWEYHDKLFEEVAKSSQ
jgi:protein-disulfide isomerase